MSEPELIRRNDTGPAPFRAPLPISDPLARLSDPRYLAPAVLDKFAAWLRDCNSRGVAVHVYETLRTNERQAQLYAQGRTAPGKIVTNAKPGQSKHNPDANGEGHAWDAVPWEWLLQRGEVASKLDWSPFVTAEGERLFRLSLAGGSGDLSLLDPRWRVMVECADRHSIEWAGRWLQFVEYVHMQFVS